MIRFWGGAAIVAGVLYWASKQPGGIPGTWERLKGAVGDVRNGADPVAAGRRFVRGDRTAACINDPALRPGF